MTKHDNVSQEGIMKATEFVKKHGWESVISAFLNAPDGYDFQSTDLEPKLAKDGSVIGFDCKVHTVSHAAVKQLVESFETVGIWGGLPAAKAHLKSLAERCANGGLESVRGQYKILRKAIADVEACQ